MDENKSSRVIISVDMPSRVTHIEDMETGDTEMELVLNEINLEIQAERAFIMPDFFSKKFGRALAAAAFRAADMTGYTKRGSVWFRD